MTAASPGHERLDALEATEDLGHDVSAHLADDLAVPLVVLASGHHVRDERDAAVGRRDRLDRLVEAVDRQGPLVQLLDGRLRRGFVRLRHDDLERQRGALRPFLVEQVDALHAVDRIRERGEVGLADVQPQGGERHEEQEPAGGDERDDRVAHDPAHDRRPHAAPLRPVATEERDPQPVDVVAEDGKGRRQERQRADDRDEDDRDRADGHRPEEHVVEQEQAADGEHHRQPGEEHGPPGRRRRDPDRFVRLAAVAPLRPVARDHEQRVVDRDRETDQDDELAGVRAHRIDGLAVQTEDPERGEERRDRQHERHHRGDDRAEGDEQDEERQRDRQPQRRVQPAVDELLDVLVGQRPVERMDPQIRVCGP